MALIGVGFLLLPAGLEIDFDQPRGRLLSVALIGFAVSFVLALGVSYGLSAGGVVSSPFLIAVILSATSLAVVLPLLKDSGLIESRFGQVVIAGASIADVATVVLLSLFFSGEATSLESRLVLFAVFGLSVCDRGGADRGRWSSQPAIGRTRSTPGHHRPDPGTGDVSAPAGVQYRGPAVRARGDPRHLPGGRDPELADSDDMMSHSHFRAKLEEAGFGFFIPAFSSRVASGSTPRRSLRTARPGQGADFPDRALIIRGLPALLYRPLIGGRLTLAAGVLQATTLSFVLIDRRSASNWA